MSSLALFELPGGALLADMPFFSRVMTSQAMIASSMIFAMSAL